MLYRRVLSRTGDPAELSEYEDRSVIALATSDDGLHFRAERQPAIQPDSDEARIGVEDPTVVRDRGEYVVFYTGWSGWSIGIANLLWARGPSLDRLVPQGIAIAPTAPERFVKEAELWPSADGWHLWCEVARLTPHERSRMAVSRAETPLGPWSPPQVVAEPRTDAWDGVNVSTGPLFEDAGHIYMLYNGMTRVDDPDFVHAARVGLLELDPQTGKVLARSVAPVLEPPPGGRIAFAGSVVEDILYYTVDDREIWAARLARSAVGSVLCEV